MADTHFLKLYFIIVGHASVVSDSVRPIDGSPPGSPVPGILQARTLECVAISFSKAWKWKGKVKSIGRVRLLLDPMDCSPPGSSVHGIFQARGLQWGAIAFSNFIISNKIPSAVPFEVTGPLCPLLRKWLPDSEVWMITVCHSFQAKMKNYQKNSKKISIQPQFKQLHTCFSYFSRQQKLGVILILLPRILKIPVHKSQDLLINLYCLIKGTLT